MSFNWQIFAANFLDQMTTGIKTRTAEAEEYKKEQKAAAERNYSLIQQRNNKAQAVASYGRQAMALLENHPNADAIVRTAISSGPTGMIDLYEKLNTAANQPGMEGGLGLDDINAIINMPSIPEIDPSYIDMSLEDFAKQTYGATLSTPMEEAETDERNMMAQLFGFGAMEEAGRELSQQEFARGMSVSEINTLARQEEFQSLLPGSTMTLRDLEVFAGDALSQFASDMTTRMAAAASAVERADLSSIGPNQSAKINEARATAANLVVAEYASRYGASFWNNSFTKRFLDNSLYQGAYEASYNDYHDVEDTEEAPSQETETTLQVGDQITAEGYEGSLTVVEGRDGLSVITEDGGFLSDEEAEAVLRTGQKVETEEKRTADTPLSTEDKSEAREHINTILRAADYDLQGLLSLSIPGNEVLAQGKRNMARAAFNKLRAVDPGMKMLDEMINFAKQNKEQANEAYGEELAEALRTLDVDTFFEQATNLNRMAQMRDVDERGLEGYSEEQAQQHLEWGGDEMLSFLLLKNGYHPNIHKDGSYLADISDEELTVTLEDYMTRYTDHYFPPMEEVIRHVRQLELPPLYNITPSREFPQDYHPLRRR